MGTKLACSVPKLGRAVKHTVTFFCSKIPHHSLFFLLRVVLKTSMQVVLSGSVGDHRAFYLVGCKNSDHGEGAVEVKKSNPKERREGKEGECTCRWEERRDPCSAPV